MKSIILSFSLLTSLFCLGQETLSIESLSPLFDKEWAGTLMYLDYGSKKEVSIPIKMTVEPNTARSVKMNFVYPGEEGANNSAKVEISKDGKKINGQTIESIDEIGDGNLELITSDKGKDNGKPATFTYTYIIGPNIYSNEKFVLYEGAEKAFIRNRYTLRPVDQ